MAKLTTPLSLSYVLKTEFGIGSTSLSALSPSTATDIIWGRGNPPGFVPYNTTNSSGTVLTKSNYKSLSNFVNCYYVVGSVMISISETSATGSAAVLATCGISNICGRVSATVSGGTVTVSSTWPAGGTSSCTVTPILTSVVAGSSTTYSFSSFKLATSSNSYSNGVFKVASTTRFAPTLTDSYSGWYTSGASYNLVGFSTGGRRYVTVYVRNRVS